MTDNETAVITATDTAEVMPTPAEAAEVATPEEGAAPEATPAEAAETQTATTAWAGVSDPYDVLDLEDFKPALAARDRLTRDQIRAPLESEFAEKTRRWESTNAYQTISSHMGRIEQALQNGEDASGAIDRLMKLMGPYEAEAIEGHKSDGRNEGRSGAANHFWALLNDGLKGMDTRTRSEFFQLGEDGADWPKIIDRFKEVHTDKLKAKHKEELEAKDKIIEQLKLGQREGTGPNGAATAPSTRGTTSYKTILEAQVDHAEGRITNDQMREIRASGLPLR